MHVRSPAPRPVGQPGVPGPAVGGHEQLGEPGIRGERLGDRLRALDEEGAVALAQGPLSQLAGRPQPGRADPGLIRAGRDGHARARLRRRPGQAARAWSARPVVSGSAFLATSTRAANAAASATASSASIRRSTSTPAALSPCTNRL